MVLDRKAPGGELLQQVMLGRNRKLVTRCFHVEAEDPQASTARDFGIELTQRARRGVPRIGERWVAGVSPLLVQLPEPRLREIDLAARSEEHTSELQSRENLVCRLL